MKTALLQKSPVTVCQEQDARARAGNLELQVHADADDAITVKKDRNNELEDWRGCQCKTSAHQWEGENMPCRFFFRFFSHLKSACTFLVENCGRCFVIQTQNRNFCLFCVLDPG